MPLTFGVLAAAVAASSPPSDDVTPGVLGFLVVAAIGVALGGAFYWEAAGTTLLVLLVLQGLGRVERLVARQSTQSTLLVHARPEPTALDELETMVRRTGLEIERQASRRENVDLVIEFTLRGPKRLHDEVMIALLHHPGVRTVSTGE